MVENRNGLVRFFFPKKCNLDNIEDRAIQQAEAWIPTAP